MTDSNINQPKNRHDSSRSDRRSGLSGRSQRGYDRGEKGGGQRGGNRGDQRGRGGQGGRGQGSYRDRDEQRRHDDLEGKTPQRNPADLRSSNRPDRGRSPNIDDDVTGRELDKSVQRELGALDEQNRPWVQKHLVMAHRLMDEDPELAFDHALAASRRGGRLGVVREAAGMTAYAAGKFSEALREFRTYRRISGDHAHLPEMVDSERALGRREKALQLVDEAQLDKLPVTSRVELAIVVSGIHLDSDDPKAAVRALEIPELNPRRGFPYSPRLFGAYAEALAAAGRQEEARKWSNLAARAERALGLAVEPEPEILDLVDDEEEQPAASTRARDVIPPTEAPAQTPQKGGDE
ncbi:MAG: hypothetical protein HLX51_10515 [Micrococcaceae bacterium]|nr:hypothetical protein [Micrococcaceae bacterium]